MTSRHLVLAARSHRRLLALAGNGLAGSPSLVCSLPQGSEKLPATARRGFIDHLLQYPDVRLATPAERGGHEASSSSSRRRRHGKVGAAPPRAERAGFDTRTAPGSPATHPSTTSTRSGIRSRGAASILDVTRPKALIYANAPGRPLVLVGAMWSTRDGERGPTPAGPIMRWHSHVVCKAGKQARPQASCGRHLPARFASHAGHERDAARLVHARSAERVRDSCPGARAVPRRLASRAATASACRRDQPYSCRSSGVSSRPVARRRSSASATSSEIPPQMRQS